MRIPIVLVAAAVAGALSVCPAEAQSRAPVSRPLPAMLTPAASVPARAALDGVERGLLTGALVGMAAGGLYGVFWAPECEAGEDGCTLSPGYRTVVFTIIGGALGAVVGAGAGLLGGDGGWDATAHPARGGGVAVAAALRH